MLSDYLEKYGAITGRAITPQVMQIYWEALQDLPLNRLRAGLREWLETGDRWPWPAQIREAGEL